MKPKLLLLITILLYTTTFSQPPDLILTNGKIFTSNIGKLYVQAIAIKGNRVMAVGRAQTIDKLKKPTTKVIDLKGKTVVPGF